MGLQLALHYFQSHALSKFSHTLSQALTTDLYLYYSYIQAGPLFPYTEGQYTQSSTHSAHTYPPLFRNSAFTSSTPLAFPPFNLLTAPNTSFILTSVSAFSNTLTFIPGLAVISA